MKGVKLRPWCLEVSHWNIKNVNEKGYLTFTPKGNLEYNLNFILYHFHKFLSYINEKDKSDHDMLI